MRLRTRAVAVSLAASLVAGLLSISVAAPASAAPTQAQTPSLRDYLINQPVEVMSPKLVDALNSVDATQHLGILVSVKDTEFQNSDMFALRDMGFAPIVRYKILPVAYATGTPDMIRQLAANPRTKRIELNEAYEYSIERSTAAVKANEGAWDRYVKEGSRISMPITGDKVAIAVLDSGVDATHSDLEYGTKTVANYRIAQSGLICAGVTGCTGYDNSNEAHGSQIFFEGDNLWADTPNSDADGHGSHVAGIAAGNGAASSNSLGASVDGSTPATSKRGVAPGASIVGIGVGYGPSMATSLFGFDFLYDQLKNKKNPFNIRVVNNSWGSSSATGGDPGEFSGTDFTAQSVMILSYDMDRYAPAGKHFNLHFTFAAGNGGAPTAGTPITSPQSRNPVVISVGGTTRNGQGMYSASSRGGNTKDWTHPDVSAPGEGIFSVLAHASNVGSDYIGKSGTSMSTPHVSGAIADMLQANPDLTISDQSDDASAAAPADYKNSFFNKITEAEWILKATATHVTGAGTFLPGASYIAGSQTSKDDGYGLINVEKAVAAALALKKLRAANPSATVADAVALVPSIMKDVTEQYDNVNTLQTAWSGQITSSTAAINGQFPVTVPSTFSRIDLTLRWAAPFARFGVSPRQAPEPIDFDVYLRYPKLDGTNSSWTAISALGVPAIEGSKTASITPANVPNAVYGDPLKPWTFAVSGGLAQVKADFWVEATMTHSGQFVVQPNSTTFVGPGDVIRNWGDWKDADNGTTANHLETAVGSGHSVVMKYYDLGSDAGLKWSSKGNGNNGSAKFDARQVALPQLPTKQVRLGSTAWGSWHQATVTDPVDTTVNQATLTLSGASAGQYSDPASVSALLKFDGVPAANRLVTFALGSLTATATTNASGVATAPFNLLLPPANYPLTASWAGVGATIPPAAANGTFTINLEDSALGLAVTANGADAVLTATLKDADTAANRVVGETVTFKQGSTVLGTSTTDTNGVATFTVPNADPNAGSLTAEFAGNTFYLPSVSTGLVFNPQSITLVSVTDPIRDTNLDNVSASGQTLPGSTVNVVFSDGLHTVSKAATVAAGGAWSASAIDASGLANGPINVTATATGTGGTATAIRTVQKLSSILAPTVLMTGDGFGYVGANNNPEAIKIKVTNNSPQASNDVHVVATDSLGAVTDLGTYTMLNGESKNLLLNATTLADGILTTTASIGTKTGSAGVTLDRGKPTATIDAPGIVISLPLFGSVSFSGTAADSLSPVASVRVTLKSGNNVIQTLNATRSAIGSKNTNWNVSFSQFLTPGTSYSIVVKSIDEANNTSDNVTSTFTVL